MSKQSTQNQAPQYFDLITTGVGYLNRYREVKPDRGPAYKCCTINALVGPSDSVEYREFDVRLVGWQALDALAILAPHVEAKKKVLVTFRIGDAMPSDYTYTRTDRTSGQSEQVKRFCNKGRLLQIMSAKVDGQDIELPQVERPEHADKTGTDN